MADSSPSPSAPPVVAADQLEQVVAGTRAIAALIAEPLAALEPSVTMPQWRVLVLAHSGECNVSDVANDLGVHLSNASRICDRLVSSGLLRRRRDERDRRHVLLELTDDGQSLFEQAMAYRRARLERAMTLMSADELAALVNAMSLLTVTLAASRPR